MTNKPTSEEAITQYLQNNVRLEDLPDRFQEFVLKRLVAAKVIKYQDLV